MTKGPGAERLAQDEGLQVSVMGGFGFWEGGRAMLTLAGGSQRLLAFLALRDRSVRREEAAGTLFPDASPDHAYGSLRSMLSRLDRDARRAVLASFTELCLADGVTVDLEDSRALAHRILSGATTLPDSDLGSDAISTLSEDVLPGWYDDWVMVEAEDWRQLRLHALEALAARLSDQGRYGEAAASALAAVRAEPLRESAHGALIRIHLAEGNQSEAIDEFERYRELLRAELGLEPTAKLRDLLDEILEP